MEVLVYQAEWLEIGNIVSPQGLKGELKVKASSDFPDRFEQPGQRWLQRHPSEPPEAVELLSGYQIPGKNIFIIKLAEVTDIDAAEKLRGCKLLVTKSDRPQLDTDEYHVSELIDIPVYHQLTGEKIGVICAILYGGNDLLEVKLESESELKKVLIPFVKEIVPLVDLANRRIEINPPIGLLELND